jgi:vitamin B12 transporter
MDVLAQLSGGATELPGWPHDLTPDDRQEDARAAAVVRYARGAGRDTVWTVETSARHDRLDIQLRAVAGGRPMRQRSTAGALRLGTTTRFGAHALDGGVTAGAEELTADGFGGTRQRVETALHLADEIGLAEGRLRLGPAVRLERVGPFNGWSASLGATARLAGPFVARASAGRTFRAPSLAELYLEQGLIGPNPELVPEEGLGGGASIAAEGRLGIASVGAFMTLYRDLIVYQAATFQRLRPANTGKALVRGLELEATSSPVGRAHASASIAYTLLLTETLQGEAAVVGRELPRKPRHRLFARAAAAPGPFEVHGEMQLVGRQFVDPRNDQEIPGAVTLGLGGSMRVTRRPDVRLHLDIRNLLDDRSVQDSFGNPLPSRMVLLGLRVASPQ